jgi:hypothetical protein
MMVGASLRPKLNRADANLSLSPKYLSIRTLAFTLMNVALASRSDEIELARG